MLTLSIYLSAEHAEKIEVLRKRRIKLSEYFRDAGLQRFESERETFDKTDKAVTGAVESAINLMRPDQRRRISESQERHRELVEKAVERAASYYAGMAVDFVSQVPVASTAEDADLENDFGTHHTYADLFDLVASGTVPEELEYGERDFFLGEFGVPFYTDEMRTAGREAFLQTLAKILNFPISESGVAQDPAPDSETPAAAAEGKPTNES